VAHYREWRLVTLPSVLLIPRARCIWSPSSHSCCLSHTPKKTLGHNSTVSTCHSCPFEMRCHGNLPLRSATIRECVSPFEMRIDHQRHQTQRRSDIPRVVFVIKQSTLRSLQSLTMELSLNFWRSVEYLFLASSASAAVIPSQLGAGWVRLVLDSLSHVPPLPSYYYRYSQSSSHLHQCPHLRGDRSHHRSIAGIARQMLSLSNSLSPSPQPLWHQTGYHHHRHHRRRDHDNHHLSNQRR